MKTKQIPAVVMLLAGFVTCIVAIFQGMEQGKFLKILLVVLISFYVAGCIVKVILDRNFKEMEEETKNEEEKPDEENVDEQAALDDQAQE